MKTKKGFKLIEAPRFNVLSNEELNKLNGGTGPICICNINKFNIGCLCNINKFNITT
jgi:hypothetical protein